MLVRWLKSLAVSAVVEDINSNGQVRRALKETEGKAKNYMEISSVSPEKFAECCQKDSQKIRQSLDLGTKETQ